MIVDPWSLGAKAATAAAPSIARRALRMWRLRGTTDFAVVGLGDGVTWLTPKQRSDVGHFLASENVRTVLIAVGLLAVTQELEHGDRVDTLRTAFVDQARIWHEMNRPSDPWASSAQQIFDDTVEKVIELTAVSEGLEPSEIDHGFGGLLESRIASSAASAIASYLSRLLDVATDFGRSSTALALSLEALEVLNGRSLPPIISHTDIQQRADHEALYINRSLVHEETGELVAAEPHTFAGAPFRMVLRGNPGAGKSTFVRHLSHALARESDAIGSGQAALVLRCRDFDPSSSLPAQLAGALQAEGVSAASVDVLEDALLLGQFVVIFDGLDEIGEVERRSTFVGRVESFASKYPTTSVLVTSRILGYERTGLSRSQFSHFRLEEFSLEQVREYSVRWFTARQKPELAEVFMTESDSVNDLRKNPLLLSLLCILFGARGSIPRRRREIYFKCADLLFHTWDSHRHIDQPEELPAYGNRIMQQIARWVYKSPAAQNGLEERQIVKVISLYLASVGVDAADAQRRAADFLEFCAGRAWMLGSFGRNDHDERIFTFTHRTFYEYFAAEAFCRESSSHDKLAHLLLEAFGRDTTSVLPELLIQAWDEKEERGASEVFRLICRQSSSPGLILRLMNGALLPRSDRSIGFRSVVDLAAKAGGRLEQDAVLALFGLNQTAITQFVEEWALGTRDDAVQVASILIDAYANVDLAELEHSLPEYVHGLMLQVIDRFVADPDLKITSATYNFFLLLGHRSFATPSRSPHSPLGVVTIFGPRCGALPRAVALKAQNRSARHHDELIDAWLAWIKGQQRVPDRWFAALSHVKSEDLGSCALLLTPGTWASRAGMSCHAAAASFAVGVGESIHPGALVSMRGISDSGTLMDALVVRNHALGSGPEPTNSEIDSAVHFCEGLPSWARRWREGGYQMTKEN